MAILTNTFNPDSAKGLRENLQNIIYTVSPMDTPFSTQVGKNTATSPLLYEWQLDSLATPDGSNAQLQGDNIASFDAVTATTRVGNRLQISRKTVSISRSENKALKAGRKDELPYQLVKKGKELRRDIETIALKNQTQVAPVSGATAGLTAGVLSWIKTNSDKAGDGSDPATSGSNLRTDGTQRTMAESNIKSMLQKVYISSGEQPDLIMAAPNLKVGMSAFAANSTRFVEAESKKLVGGIDVYVSDWGTHRLVPNRFMRGGLTAAGREVLAINTKMWKMVWFDPIQMIELAKTGDADNRMLICEWTIEASNEAASGGSFDLQ